MDKLTFNFTIEQVNTILAGLGELPAKSSMDMIINIREQAAPQLPDNVVQEPEVVEVEEVEE